MDLASLFTLLTDFYYRHTVVAIAMGVVFLLLVCFRPKAMLKTAGLVLALAVAAYFFTQFLDMAESGRSQKKDMVETVR
jgi:hypothetical protein